MSNAPYEIDEEEISNEAIAVYKEGFSPEKVDSYLEMKGAVYGWQDNHKHVFKSAYNTIDKRMKKAESIQSEALSVLVENVPVDKYMQMKREVYGVDDEWEEIFNSLHENFKSSPEMKKTVQLATMVDMLKKQGTTEIDPDKFGDPEIRRGLKLLFTEQDPLIKIPDNWKLKVDEKSLGKPVRYISPRQTWEAQGGRGFNENIGDMSVASKVPGLGFGLSLGEAAMIKRSIDRLDEAQKSGKDIFNDKEYENEIDWLQNISVLAQHDSMRGSTWAADIANVLMDAPAFIVEFLVSGGAATAGKQGVKKLIADKVIKGAAKSALARGALSATGLLASAATRTATIGLPRIAKGYIERRTPDVIFENAHKLRIEEAKDQPITALYKAVGDTFIEYLSEESGEVISKLGGKAIGKLASKSQKFKSLYEGVQNAWMKATRKGSAEWAKRLEDIGWHGIVSEMGEERLGDVLRSVTGVSDQSLKDALIPTGRQFLTEAVAFAIMGGGFSAAGWVQKNPKAAEELANVETPSRKNMPKDLPKMNLEDRKKFVDEVRQIVQSRKEQREAKESEIPKTEVTEAKEPIEPPKSIEAQPEAAGTLFQTEQEEEVEPPVIKEGAKATADEMSVESAWYPDKDIVRVPTKDILSDPDTFQYKLNIDKKTGVKEPLKGPWDDEISGIMTLWQAKDGKVYVVNGFHRLELAQREGVENVRAVVLKESDGITARAARFRGAVQNIKSGRGSIEDAATMWRLIDDKDIKAAEISYKGNPKDTIPYRIGRLATDETYELWRNGKISDGQASAISAAAPRSGADQKTAIDYVFDYPKASEGEIRSYLESLKHFASPDYIQGDIFGSDADYLKNKEIEKRMNAAAARKVNALEAALSMVNKGDKIDKSALAKQLGLSVQSEKDLNQFKIELKSEISRYRKFFLHKDLENELRQAANLEYETEMSKKEKAEEKKPEPVVEKKVEPELEVKQKVLSEEELSKMKMNDLKALPEAQGIKRASKASLVKAILEARQKQEVAPKEVEAKKDGTFDGKAILKYWADNKTRPYQSIINSVYEKNKSKGIELDDITSEADFGVLQSLSNYDENKPNANFEHFVNKVVSNHLKEVYGKISKKKSKERELTEGADVRTTEPEVSNIEKEETKASLEKAISKLEEVEQKIIRMGFYENKSIDQISEELDIPRSTVASKKKKALKSLFNNIEGYTDQTGAIPSSGAMSYVYQGDVEEGKKPDPVGLNMGEMLLVLDKAGAVVPIIKKKLGDANGRFRHINQTIELRADIFIGPIISTGLASKKDVETTRDILVGSILAQYPNLSAEKDLEIKIESVRGKSNVKRITIYRIDPTFADKVLAHEIGHWVDYMPDETMGRGNILGRLLTLRNYLKTTIDSMSQTGMDNKALTKLRREAEKMTGKRVKKKEAGYEEWKEAYDKNYNELVKNAGFISKGEIMTELKDLTQWWKPFDVSADKRYTEYRFSSKELYADALSVLLNSPAELRERAPMFYATFFQNFDKKPDVKAAYEQTVKEVVSGTSRGVILNGMYEGFERAEVEKRKVIESNKRDFSISDTIGTAFIDRFWNVYKAVSKAKKMGKKYADPREIIDYAQYSGSQLEEYRNRNHKIAVDLEKENISKHDFGIYLFIMRHKHAEGEGGKRAIPMGIGTLETLNQVEKEFKERMGERKMAALEQARKDFRKIREQFILDRIDKSRPYDQDYIDFLKRNEYYSRNEVIDYIDSRHGQGTGLKMYGRVGTLKEVNNPWFATMEADMSLIHSLNWNHAKQTVADFMKETGEGLYQEADKKWDGGKQIIAEPSDKKLGLITFMRDGKLEGFYTEKNIADAFNQMHNASINMVASMLRIFAHPMRMWFTTARPGFQLYNVGYKDPMRTIVNTGLSPLKVYPQLLKSLVAVAQDTITHSNKELAEMRERGLLIHNHNLSEQDEDTKQLERFLGEVKSKGMWEKIIENPIKRFWSTYLTINNIGEVANKHAGFVLLKKNKEALKLTDEEIDHRVRHWVGSPSFITGGNFTPITNNLILFSNAAVQGWRSDIEAFKEDPKGVALRRLAYTIAPKMAVIGLMTGAVTAVLKSLGADDDDEIVKWAEAEKRVLNGVSEYDLANYHVIPIGLDENDKSIYLRMPQDETGRIISGAVTKLFTSQDAWSGIQDAARFMGDQGPGMNPAYTLGSEVLKYFSGGNPYDDFREKKAVPQDIRDVGGIESHKIFGKWLWNRYGGSMIYRFNTSNPAEIKTQLQEFLDLPFAGDTVGRFIRISDYGITQKMERAAKEARKEQTRTNIEVDEAVRKKMSGKELSESEEQLLDENYKRAKQKEETLQKYGGSSVDKAMERAQSADEKAAALKELINIHGNDNPAVVDAVNTFVGQQLYQATDPKPKDRKRAAEWEKDREKAIERVMALPVKNRKAAFDAYWKKLGFKKYSVGYLKRVRMLRTIGNE